MAKRENADRGEVKVCINEFLNDDGLRAVLAKLEREEERDAFGLVCKRWLRIQSSERRRIAARAGPAMLRRMADRFSGIFELDLSQSSARSFYPGITDSDISVIVSGFRSLRILNMHDCKGVSDAGMIALGNGLPSLQSLDVSFCRKLTDKGLTAIALGCSNLKRLQLIGCKSITDDLLRALSKNCSHLEELGFYGCANITDSGLSNLVDGCRHIKSVDVSKCSKIGDIGVSRVAEVCSSSLRTLKMWDCYKVGDKSILQLAESCHNLETLTIGGCRDVSDEAIKSLAIACGRSLRSLRMDWCLNITDSSLSCVLSSCKYLLALDIGCCDKVTDLGFHGLVIGGSESELKVLKICNLPRITVSGIGKVLQFCKSLKYLDLRSCPNVNRLSCDQAGLIFPDSCKANFTGSLLKVDPTIDLFF